MQQITPVLSLALPVTDLRDVPPAAREADVFIAEAYFRDKKVMLHLDLATLEAHLDEIRPKRLVLTHMSDDMLDHLGELPHETAEDGRVITIA